MAENKQQIFRGENQEDKKAKEMGEKQKKLLKQSGDKNASVYTRACVFACVGER